MHALARIIDANANRAREALRVMEDAARFALNDEGLCSSLKELRHDLRGAIDAIASLGLDRGMLLANRDTPADVGTSVATPAEGSRQGLRGVVLAAGSRLGEALRAIEESTKALETDRRTEPAGARAVRASASLEQIRYRAYELEKQLGLALPAAGAPQWRLCVLISDRLCTHLPWDRVAEQSLEGGADCLQLREKELDSGELLARARRLVEIAHATRPGAHRAHVIVNDRPDIALLAGADGVHVGQTDLHVHDVRRLAGFRLLVGVSTGSLDQARRAARDGADYFGCGPMFATTTKHKPALAGPEYLAQYVRDPALGERPHLAIGGITPENVELLARVGCRGVAVSSVVCGSPDPRAVCERLARSLG